MLRAGGAESFDDYSMLGSVSRIKTLNPKPYKACMGTLGRMLPMSTLI